ncbi:hypothetical protein M8J76_011399 [Diaphorina citri]|nr:hypothetical protein M8J76_011399 [Diaphorina citri]
MYHERSEVEQFPTAPRLDLPNLDSGYHGLVRENETLVEVTPTIRALGDVCSFRIVNKHHGDAPFQKARHIVIVKFVTIVKCTEDTLVSASLLHMRVMRPICPTLVSAIACKYTMHIGICTFHNVLS